MIVKVIDDDENSCAYYGDVVQIKTYCEEEIPEVKVGETVDSNTVCASIQFAELLLRNGGGSLQIPLKFEAYLLDDNGNTIERL